jgi:hypothetical protein
VLTTLEDYMTRPTSDSRLKPTRPDRLREAFAYNQYLLPDHAATVLFLAIGLDKPVLVEG